MKRLKSLLMLLSIAGIFAFSASAQSRIISLVNQLEKSSNADVTYVEKRDPKTKEIISTTTVLSVPDSQVKSVIDAINAERPNSLSFEKTGNKVFKLKLESKTHITSVTFVVGDNTEAYNNGIPYNSSRDNKSNILMIRQNKNE